MPRSTPAPCMQRGCLFLATHGVYYVPGKHHWYIISGPRRYPGKAPIRYCRWHATCEAVCRNAGQEVPA